MMLVYFVGVPALVAGLGVYIAERLTRDKTPTFFALGCLVVLVLAFLSFALKTQTSDNWLGVVLLVFIGAPAILFGIFVGGLSTPTTSGEPSL
jgi:hypothetical protein